MPNNEFTKDVAKKLTHYTDRKRREDGFDLTGPQLPRNSQPVWSCKPGSVNYAVKKGASLKCYSKDQALTNYLTRLNDMYAEDLEEIELKAQVAKLIAAGKMGPTQMVIVGAKPQKAFAHSANMLNAAYNSDPKANPRYYRTKCRRAPSAEVTRGEAERMSGHATHAVLQTEKLIRARSARNGVRQPSHPANADYANEVNANNANNANTLQWSPTEQTLRAIYTPKEAFAENGTGQKPLTLKFRTRSVPVKVQRPASAPPLGQGKIKSKLKDDSVSKLFRNSLKKKERNILQSEFALFQRVY